MTASGSEECTSEINIQLGPYVPVDFLGHRYDDYYVVE